MKRPIVRLRLLQIVSFFVSSAPLMVTVIYHRKEWFSTPEESVKIGIGAIIAFGFILMKALGYLKIPPRIVTYGLIFAMSYLLKSILDNLILLSGMALLGEMIDLIFFQTAIRRTRENITNTKTAEATSEQVEKLFERYIGSGRT